MDPMHQFEVITLVPIEVAGVDLSFTNASLWMLLAVVVIVAVLWFGMRRRAIVPTRLQLAVELLYEFLANMVKETVGNEGRPYFPFLFTLFAFVLAANMLGMIPYAFTTTSHIIVTFAMAVLVFVGVTLIGLVKHGFGFFRLFLPEGVPMLMAPLVVPIEILSYIARPISLSVRLFANMMAGHTMLKVFAGFSVMMGAILGIGPLALNVALTGFEFLVAVLQAYVFTILSCIYLNDALHPHH